MQYRVQIFNLNNKSFSPTVFHYTCSKLGMYILIIRLSFMIGWTYRSLKIRSSKNIENYDILVYDRVASSPLIGISIDEDETPTDVIFST